MSIEDAIVPVSEVFRLQNVEELQRCEERYLPSAQSDDCSGLILAASKGDFGELVRERPKAMLNFNGKPILSWHTDAFRRQGIRRIGAVRGYCKEAVDLADIHYFDNDDYENTGEVASLYAAREFLRGDLVIAYGDIIFDDFILRSLLADPHPIAVAVDSAWQLRGRADEKRDLVVTSGTRDPLGERPCQLEAVGNGVDAARATGEWIGLLRLRAEETEALVRLLETMASERPEQLRTWDLPALLQHMVDDGRQISVVHSYGHWYDLDNQKGLVAASSQVAR